MVTRTLKCSAKIISGFFFLCFVLVFVFCFGFPAFKCPLWHVASGGGGTFFSSSHQGMCYLMLFWSFSYKKNGKGQLKKLWIMHKYTMIDHIRIMRYFIVSPVFDHCLSMVRAYLKRKPTEFSHQNLPTILIWYIT